MKEKVERLAKGHFEYDIPGILLSEEEIQITVEAGKSFSGSFTIKNTKHTPMRGVLYSSSKQFQLEQDCFTLAENVIHYHFRAENMNPGEITKCEICIVSDCGEIQIPVTVNVEIPYFNSSLGKIKDLYNFANLAKSDWAEALKLFKSEEFQQLMLHYEAKYDTLYQNLLKSRSTSQALEEFLIAIHKKLRINLQVDKVNLEYDTQRDRFMDKIILTKDNWGYTEIRVSTDAPFLTLEHKIIWSDNFIGNHYALEFVVEPDKMHAGNNYGRIYLKTTHQTIIIEIKCKSTNLKSNSSNHQIKVYKKQFSETYLGFRCNEISFNEYIEKSYTILEQLFIADDKNLDRYHLLRIHLLIITGKDTEAKQLLELYKEKSDTWKQADVLNYCGYRYLIAMLNKEETVIQDALLTIKSYYDSGYHDWKLLWFLLYIDTKYDRYKNLKLDAIKMQYMEGCHSPILYYEAITVLNLEPFLLHEIGDFELQTLRLGIRHNLLSEDMVMQITYLAGKNKEFNKLLYECLVALYEKYKMKDILMAICSILIKGHQRNCKYHEWFRLGVEEQLRITELYEYYLYSLDETSNLTLPQPILLYFIYNSSLNDKKKAFLYAYIIKNKNNHLSIYQAYYKHMEQFALKQIAARNISDNLAVLYNEIIMQRGINAEFAANLANIMFKNDIYCKNPNIRGIYIINKKINREEYKPFVNGTAQVDIYTENAEILLVDGYDNRYATTIEYTMNKLMPWENYINTCYEYQIYHPYILIYLSEKAQNYQKFDEQSIEIRKRILELPDLSEAYYKKTLQDLIYFYYDNFEGELLESYLHKIDINGISKTDRDKIIEFFIIREIYERAYRALDEYGFDGISINRLIKLCSNLIDHKKEDDEKDVVLLNLCYYVFHAGKYNVEILKYLVKYYFGTTSDMFYLWKTSMAFEIDTTDLEERLLGQMLFAESYITDSISVFMEYYKKGCNHDLIRAFLSYNAFKYLTKDRIIQPELFQIMKREVAYEENEVCTLALLKDLSTKEEWKDAEIEFIQYNVNKMIKRGIVFPFYLNFKKHISIPIHLMNKYFVEYKTNPSHTVTINYRMEGKHMSEEFIAERMVQAYCGIFIKQFILFYNECIQYYITEEDEAGNITITESVRAELDQNMQLEEDTKFNHLNFMLAAMDMQDEKTLIESMESFIKKEYIISKIFKPI